MATRSDAPSMGGTPVVPEHIYFDMDGVLADFDRGVEELAGFVQRYGQGESPEEDDLMWEAIRHVDHFYDRLAPLPGSLELFRELHGRYGDRCAILTGIPTPRRHIDTAGEDKVSWCRRLLPEGVEVNVVYRREKRKFCKGRESILIDDFSENVAAWEAAGGTGILFRGADDARRQLMGLGIL